MAQELWTAFDHFISETLIPSDPVLEHAVQTSTAGGLPAWQVAPNQGKLLYLIARMIGAKRILEIGTLGGYSTIWLGRALPSDGKLITLERDAKYADVAKANIERAGLAARVELRLGAALDSLAELEKEGALPFDLVFIDADKPNNLRYLEHSLRLSRVGTVIVGDNVVRDGAVMNPADKDPAVAGTREFLKILGSDPRVDATAIQTVGSKGYDGFALAIVKSVQAN